SSRHYVTPRRSYCWSTTALSRSSTSISWRPWSVVSACSTRAIRSTAPVGWRADSTSVCSDLGLPRRVLEKGLSAPVRSGPLRFSPSGWQLMALDAIAGAAGLALAMLLRFVDEGSVPATYLQRLWPWLAAAAVLQIAVGE